MLKLYRRHRKACKFRGEGGVTHLKCACPIWCDGEVDGRRLRESMDTADWQRAVRKLAERENPTLEFPKSPSKSLSDAQDAFLAAAQDLTRGSQAIYGRILRYFLAEAKKRGIDTVPDLTVEFIDLYRASRNLCPLTWSKELAVLRHFCGFCMERGWMPSNPARVVKSPKNIKPAPKEPYTTEEITKILDACQNIGRGSYERARARAMVLLMRYTGLRISDVATLARARVKAGKILLRTQKTGGLVLLPVPVDLEFALNVLPVPRGAGNQPEYFFWNGITSKRAVVGIAERTLAAVFEKSGVVKAHAHKFRHTLATDILSRGGTEQDAADVLGISPNIVRKHYAKWSAARQDRIFRIMGTIQSGTPVVHEGIGAYKPNEIRGI